MQEALKQIVDKKYDAELVALGVPQERIRHYGFAFAGKNVLIWSRMRETGDEGHPFSFGRKMVFLLTHYDIDSMINLILNLFYVRIFYL